MPTRHAMIEQVASQMMKGGKPGRIKASGRQKDGFKRRHQVYIEWAIDQLPRCSSAVAAVIVKCIIKYGQEPTRAFCKALRNCSFNGANDPAHLLWKFLQKHRGKDTTSVYQRAVCAAKAYMEGRTLTAIRPVKEDIFTWDDGWTVPDEYLANWTPDKMKGEKEEVASV